MKKLMTALAVCLAAGFVAAGSVTSSNVVGYVNVSVSSANVAGYSMLGLAFDKVGSPDGQLLNELLPNASNFVGGYDDADSDTISVWNGIGYDIYFFSASDFGAANQNNVWLDINTTQQPTKRFLSGTGFWFRRHSGSATITLAGQVPTGSFSLSCPASNVGGFSQVAYPFSTTLNLNDASLNWLAAGATGGYDDTDSDTISVWNGIGYDIYFFSASDFGAPNQNNKWLDINTTQQPVTPIALGKGMWYRKHGGTLTMTLPQPYTL